MLLPIPNFTEVVVYGFLLGITIDQANISITP